MKKSKSVKSLILMLLYSSTSGIYINFIGRLIFSELIALITFPFTKFSYLFKKYKGLKYITKAFALLFIAQVISDIINQSLSNDYLRGLSVIIFSYVSFIFILNQINKNSSTIIIYFVITFFVKLFFENNGSEIDLSLIEKESNIFKLRFVPFLNIAFLIISFFLYKVNKKKTVTILFFTFGIFCLILDARSNGLIFLITSMILLIRFNNKKINKFKIIFFLLISSLILSIGYFFYVNKVLSGEIKGSNSTEQISKMSNPYNPLELLYVGRLETYIAAIAILEKPIFGHGSWAVDKDRKYSILTRNLSGKRSSVLKKFIPSHSILLGAWLYSGILGFIAVFLMFKKLFILYLRLFRINIISRIFPILTFLTVEMIWSVFFSPYGLLRTTFPIFAALIIYFENQNSIKNKYN